MEPLKSILLAGLGAVGYSSEKLKDAVQSLIDKGELTRDQGEKVISEWVDRGRDEQSKISSKISEEVQKIITKLNLVSRDEFLALAQRVEELEGDK